MRVYIAISRKQTENKIKPIPKLISMGEGGTVPHVQ